MLDSEQIDQILEIAKTAIHHLHDKYPYSDFSLKSIEWNDDETDWQVKFYLNRGNFEYITIFLIPYKNQFEYRGYSHDN